MSKNIQKVLLSIVTAIVGAVVGSVITANASFFQFSPTPPLSRLYQGNVYNSTLDTRASITLLINPARGQGNIEGTLDVKEPLLGSGPFKGTANANSIQFKVTPAKLEPLLFLGTVQHDGSLSGTYCSLTEQNQCDVSAGKGTWSVSKA